MVHHTDNHIHRCARLFNDENQRVDWLQRVRHVLTSLSDIGGLSGNE